MAQQQFRAQAPELPGPENLQVPQHLGDTYSSPEQPPKDTNLAQLAEALGSFNTNLQHYAIADARASKMTEKQTQQAAVENYFGTHTHDEVQKNYETGQFDGFTPFQMGLVAKGVATQYADTDKANIEAAIKDGTIKLTPDDPTHPPPNIEQQIMGVIGQRKDSLSDPMAYNTYLKSMEAYRNTLATRQVEALAGQRLQVRNDMVDRTLTSIISQDGKPEDVYKTIRQAYTEMGPGSVVNMSNAELDKRLRTVLTNNIQDPKTAALALHVVGQDRTDPKTGQTLPSMAQTPGAFDDTKKLVDQARTTMSGWFTQQAKDVAAKNAEAALQAGHGAWSAMTDSPVKNPFKPDSASQEWVTADAAKKQAVQQVLADSAQQAQQNKEPADVTFNREYKLFGENGVEHPVWKNTLTDGAKSLMQSSILTDQAGQQKAIQAGELYMNLAQKNFPYAKSLLDKQSADTWETYAALRMAGMNPQQAIMTTSQAVGSPESDLAKEQRAHMAQAVSDKAKGLNFGQTFLSMIPGFKDTADNTSIVKQQVLNLATILTRAPGYDADKAIEQAAKVVTAHTVTINGYAVQDPTGQVSQNKPVIEGLLSQFVKQHGTETGVTDPKQLSVQPAGGGNYYIWSKEDGVGPGHPVFVGEKPALITGAGKGNMIDKAKAKAGDLSAIRTQAASEQAVRDRLVDTPNEKLTTDQQAAKQAELQKRSDAMSAGAKQAVSNAVQRLPGGVSPDHTAAINAQAKAVKDTASYVLGLFHKLGGYASSVVSKYGEYAEPNH